MFSCLYHAAPAAAVMPCRSSRLRRAARAAMRPARSAATAAFALHVPRRSFFSQAPPGADLLRRLAASAGEPAKAVSPLASLRPPAPPSASDAQPFGSLNRRNTIRRYVNVNAPVGADKVAAAPPPPPPTSSTAEAREAGAVTAPPPPPRMDLHRLVRRHHGSAAPRADRSAAPVAQAATAHAETGNATVAKAQAAIAAAAATRSAQAASCESGGTARGAASASLDDDQGPSQKTSGRGSSSNAAAAGRHHSQVYKERCTIGWSPEDFYRVVADVEHYAAFLPWCAGSQVHTTRRVRVPRGARRLTGPTAAAAASGAAAGGSSGSSVAAAEAAEAELVDAIEMTATLTIGFSFLKEQYTSRVTLYPGSKIVAALYDEDEQHPSAAAGSAAEAGAAKGSHSSSSSSTSGSAVLSFFKRAASTAGAVARRSILKHLLCEWEFSPVPGKPNTVEVLFSVSFEFKNPMHSHMIMSNVVTLMTRSFERRCESLYGPPSATKESLPLLS